MYGVILLINYVNMQHYYGNMQLIYDNMQNNHVYMQHNLSGMLT